MQRHTQRWRWQMAWLDSIKIVSITPQPRCTYFQELWHFRDSDRHFVGTVGVFQFQSSHISRHPVDPDNLKTGFAWLELNWSFFFGVEPCSQGESSCAAWPQVCQSLAWDSFGHHYYIYFSLSFNTSLCKYFIVYIYIYIHRQIDCMCVYIYII